MQICTRTVQYTKNDIFFSGTYKEEVSCVPLPQRVISNPPYKGHDLQLTTGADFAGTQAEGTKALGGAPTHPGEKHISLWLVFAVPSRPDDISNELGCPYCKG